jgi:hypothetical protein
MRLQRILNPHSPPFIEMQTTSRNYSIVDHIALFAVLGAVAFGAFIRLYPAMTADFPINDGGLFYRFILEIQKQGYSLPITSTYNQAQIPFVYPPLSFYLAGLSGTLLHIPLLDVIRWLPGLVSVLTIPAFFLLARAALKDETQAILAVYCFAFLPTAFDFMIVGGGLSRAFGFLFSILTLHQELRMLRSGTWKNTIGMGVFAALTVLSHPVAAWFTFFSAAIILLFEGRTRRAISQAAIVLLLTAALSAPWWVTILQRFGSQVLFSAFQAGQLNNSNFFALFLFIHTNEPLLDIQAVLALLGLFTCLKNKRYFIPLWLLAVFLLEARLSATYAVMPTVLLAAIGLDSIVLAGFSINRMNASSKMPRLNKVGQLLLLYLLIYGLVAAFISAPHDHLNRAERQAMNWIQSNLPEGHNFLVVSGISGAGGDYPSEWLPALTDQISLGTPQGSEWLPGDIFRERWGEHDTLQACFNRDGSCLDRWAAQIQRSYDYVLVTPNEAGDIGAINAFLKADPNFQPVYQVGGVMIFRHDQ